MITVVGEALVDLVIDPVGQVTAALGGAPFNTARACGRLGVDVAFVGALSSDRFGTMLRQRLLDDGVDLSGSPVVPLPTTLAAAELDDGGAASYRFYIAGTSAPSLVEVPDLDPAGAVFTGGLALVLEPMASAVAAMSIPVSTLMMVDVNCRPLVIDDRDAYLGRVRDVVSRAHVVKVSDEDVDYLFPGATPDEAAASLLALGPGAVLITGGPSGVRVVTAGGARFVPVAPVDVVDTIGAGDTFGGALLAWWTINGHHVDEVDDVDLLSAAVRAANVAAGMACTRTGAEPPRRDELPADWLV